MVIEEVKDARPETEEEGIPLSIDVVYNEVKDRLAVQMHQIESMDGKAGTLMFVAGILLGLGAAAQAAFIGQERSWIPPLLFSVPIIFYFITAFFCLKGWTSRPYFRDPEPRPLRDHYLFQDESFTKRRIITHFISTYELNKVVLRGKVRDLRWAVAFTLIFVASLVAALLVRPWVM